MPPSDRVIFRETVEDVFAFGLFKGTGEAVCWPYLESEMEVSGLKLYQVWG